MVAAQIVLLVCCLVSWGVAIFSVTKKASREMLKYTMPFLWAGNIAGYIGLVVSAFNFI